MVSPNRDDFTDIFSGNIFIFHAFDIGDDINLDLIRKTRAVTPIPLHMPKYFKNYHTPLAIELPHPHSNAHCVSVKVHSFGSLSLIYQISFESTLTALQQNIKDIIDDHKEQSVIDAKSIFKKIEHYISKPNFFDIRSSYVLIQVDTQPEKLDLKSFQSRYSTIITSTLRFETEPLSEEQAKEMLESAVGYFRGERIIIDYDAAFAYDDEYQETLDLFEFTNIQRLELEYFDRVLDRQLNRIYDKQEIKKVPVTSYVPLMSSLSKSPIDDLVQLKVDISVIIERLENTIKFSGEPYFAELYDLLVDKLDLASWRAAIDRKMNIIHDIQSIYQNKTDATREDGFSVLIALLIFIEVVFGILEYLK